MMLLRKRKAQSLIEYAILLAVVISAFLLLQGIVKRGIQGGLNDSADRLGDQYSVTNTATESNRIREDDALIVEETGSDETIGTIIGALAETGDISEDNTIGSIDQGAHSISTRTGEDFTTESRSQTESVDTEGYRWSDIEETTYGDFDAPEGF